MGKKLHVRYRAPGTRERELEVSIKRVHCLFTVAGLSFFYAITSLTSTVISWVTPPAEQLAATVYRPEVVPPPVDVQAPQKQEAIEETVVRSARADTPDTAEAPDTGEASETAETPGASEFLVLPEVQGVFVDVVDVKVTSDETNVSLSFGIRNQGDQYVKGYTYGLAKFVHADGHEELVASHPGINVVSPFDSHRYVAGLSYGARNFTSKTLHFNRPTEPGQFAKAWIVVTRAKDVHIKEVDLND